MLSALEAHRHVPLLPQMVQDGALQPFLQAKDHRRPETEGKAAVEEGVADDHERRARGGGGVEVEADHRSAALGELVLQHRQELALLLRLGGRLHRVAAVPQPPDALRGPQPVEVLVDVPAPLGQGRPVAGQADEPAAEGRAGGPQRLQRPLQGQRARGLIAVHPADADHQGSGGVAAPGPEHAGKAARTCRELSRHGSRTPVRRRRAAAPSGRGCRVPSRSPPDAPP